MRKKAEEEIAAKQRLKNKVKRAAEGDNSVESEEKAKDDEEEDGKKEEEEEKKAEVVGKQGDVLFTFYRSDTDNFVVSLNGFDTGYLYECAFGGKQLEEGEEDDTIKPIKIPEINNAAVTSLCFSRNQTYLVFGLDNGSIRIQNMKSSTLDTLDSYWSISAHDNVYGSVSAIAISFDNKFLVSTGKDEKCTGP